MTDKLSRPMHAKAVESEWEEFFPEPHRTWMKTYFKLPSNKPTNTLVAIMDEQQGKFTSRLYMNGKCVDHPHESLASALSISKHSSAKTRIVLLVHDGRRGLNRDMIGTIYQTYGLNPLFLSSHFLWDFANRKCVDHPSGTDHPSDEPFTLTHSDEFLQLEYMGAQMSAIVLENVKPSTIVVFASAGIWYSGAQTPRHPSLGLIEYRNERTDFLEDVDAFLGRIKPLQISDLPGKTERMIDYIIPLARFIWERYAFDLRTFRRDTNHRKYPDNQSQWVQNLLGQHWHTFIKTQTRFARTKEALYHFGDQDRYKNSRQMNKLLREYDDLEKQFAQFERWLTFLAQEDAALEGVKEMETANNIAKTARLIAIVAYIFVPFSFAASAFGTNLSVFGTGSVELKTFLWVSALIWVIGVTIALSLAYLYGTYWDSEVSKEPDIRTTMSDPDKIA